MSNRQARGKGLSERYEGTDWRRHVVWPEIEPRPGEVPPAAVRPRRRMRRGRSIGRWWIIPAALVGCVLLMFAAMSVIEWRTAGRVLDHVYIAGVDVGGLEPEEAEAALRLRYEAFQSQPVTLRYGDWVWRPTGDEIGLHVAWSEAITQAMSIGRSGSFLDRWGQRWRSWSSRHDLLLPLWLDETALRAYLERLARKVDVAPLDAALTVEGLQVGIRPGHPGRALQVAPSLRIIEEALLRLSREPVSLLVNTIPQEIDDAAVQGAMATAQSMLAGPIVLRLGERTWTLTPEQIGQMIRVERRQEGGRFSLMVVLDQEALRDYVGEIALEVNLPPRNAHFRFVGDHLELTDEGMPGLELAVGAVMGQINEAVLSAQREVELHVQHVLPAIRRETIDELGIREVVGVGVSSFSGSRPYRVHNIVNAARILDGTLIPPGESFSFIQAIGPIDESDGFVPGYSIVGGRTVLNVGGGVCQVSTTVFRAAFFAGLPIQERHAHDFRVGYYEHGSVLGLDATIYTGTGTDLRFANNTSGYLLMQFEVYTETGELYVYLYGTKPKYEVQLDGPYLSNWVPAPTEPVCVENPELPEGTVRQTDWAQPGVDAVVYRKILVDGVETSSEPFYSQYKAWPDVFEAWRCSR